jgi:hypothetical protein
MSPHPLPPDQLQIFFASHELPSNPLVNEIIKAGKTIAEKTDGDQTQGIISLGFGKRIIATAHSTNFSSIEQDHLIEIVDYDAYKQILLIMGKKEPIPAIAINWMLHHAKQEIRAIVLIENIKKITLNTNIQTIDTQPQSPILNQVKTLLNALQKETILQLDNQGILITGRTISDIQHQLSII